MSEEEKNKVFYICALIEYIGRITKNKRSVIVEKIGKKEIERQLELADVNHSLSFEQVSEEIINEFHITISNFDSVGECQYEVPSFTSIGKVYQRLINDTRKENESIIDAIYNGFQSFISTEISDFNSSVYYSNPEYLKNSYEEGRLLD